MTVLAVIGCRSYKNYQEMKDELDKLKGTDFPFTSIITGDCYGADAMALVYAQENNIPATRVLKPTTGDKSNRSWMIANEYMIRQADYVIAFWDSKSPGTKHAIEIAKRKFIPVKIIKF
jgi:hypothetical protein